MGTNTALPIWGYYMNKVYADSTIGISQEDFPSPINGVSGIDCNQYLINTSVPSDEFQEDGLNMWGQEDDNF